MCHPHPESALPRAEELPPKLAGRPGVPRFDLLATDGDRLRKSDFVSRRLLLTFASITCRMAASSGPALKRLHSGFVVVPI